MRNRGLRAMGVKSDSEIGIPFDKLEYTTLSRSQKHGGQFKGVGAGLALNY